MAIAILSSINQILSQPTPLFGLKLWIVISISICIFVIFVTIITFLCAKRNSTSTCKTRKIKWKNPAMPAVVGRSNSSFQDRRQLLMSRSGYPDIEMGIIGSNNMDHANEIRLSSAMNMSVPSWNRAGNGVFSLREMEVATNWFSDQNMMSGHDHYGFVYRGVLCDGTRVAVKKLQYSSGMAEDFMVKAEEIGDIQHKNLVELYGYCTESALRLLVYEYVDNGNVHWWLHECARLTSPLTWDIRLKIMLGTAKGLAYLHTEPNHLLHQNIESSNVLLDRQWNPRIFNVGIHKLTGPGFNPYLQSLGYTAPEYSYTRVFNEKTDVYSFGMLMIEIISGKYPNDFSWEIEPEGKLIDWFKSMVERQEFDHLLDPKIRKVPPLMELKKTILIALRCADADVEKRPTMEDVFRMFQPRGRLIINDYEMLFGTKDETDTACES